MTDFTTDLVHHEPNTVSRLDAVRLPAVKPNRPGLRDETSRPTRDIIASLGSTDEISTRDDSEADPNARQNMPSRRHPSTSSPTRRWPSDADVGSAENGASAFAGSIGDLNSWLKTAGRQGERLSDLVNTSDSDLWSCA